MKNFGSSCLIGKFWRAATALASLFALLCVVSSARGAAEPKGAAIFTVKPDGSDVQLLVALPKKVWHGSPAYSPDGTRVALDVADQIYGGPASHIVVADVNDPVRSAVDLGVGSCPAWSPDGKKIIFQHLAGNPVGAKIGMWTMNADGTNSRWLCEGERGRYSPDGTRIAVSGKGDGCESLYVVTGQNRQPILFERYDRVIGPTWSPDSKRVAFIGTRNDKTELAIVDASGGPSSFVVRWRGKIGWQPSWSPDGKDILFWINDGTVPTRLNLISASGEDPPREIPGQQGTFHNSDAAWSPDGSRIIFSSDRPTDGRQ